MVSASLLYFKIFTFVPDTLQLGRRDIDSQRLIKIEINAARCLEKRQQALHQAQQEIRSRVCGCDASCHFARDRS